MERQKKSYPNQPSPNYKGPRQFGGNFISEIYSSGSRRLYKTSNLELSLLSILAGGFMCVASLFSVLLSANVTSTVQYLMSGLGLTLGMLLVLLTNSVLFTDANIFVPANFKHISMAGACLRLFRFWIIAWIGNLIGALLIAYLAYLSQDFSESVKGSLSHIANLKLAHFGSTNYRGVTELIISGMLANWLIALVSFFALSSRNLMNQFVITFLVFVFIAASNFQYFPLNVSYFLLDAFSGNNISLSNAFFANLIPVSMGNISGAGLLVAVPLLFLAKKRR